MKAALEPKIKIFNEPFAYIVMNYKAEEFCSYCLKTPKNDVGKLYKCAACNYRRYCDKTCQRLAWKDHKKECKRLKNVFPNLPPSEVFFLTRICDKVKFMKQNGDVHAWQKDRKWSDLLDHQYEIKKDKEKMSHFKKMQEKTKNFMKEEMPSDKEFFEIFCKTWINSHSIHTGAGTEIGMALDLAVSKYDHCCRPNCSLVFEGFKAMLRPLSPGIDASDHKTAFISYVDVGRSRYQRNKELWSKWYFECKCDRCIDPEDDRLTSIKCPNKQCNEPILISEVTKPVKIECKSCHSVTQPERIMEAQAFMLSLPTKFNFTNSDEERERVKKYLDDAKVILHPENIYYCRLLTVYMQIAGSTAVVENPDMHKLVYENYRRCLPEADRHIGYQLLHLVKSLIQEEKRDAAIPYAFQAMTIFEVAFGLDHPYYLQTLALWTYLEQKMEKTDDQLLSLMNFGDNRRVDITSVIEKAYG